MLIHFSRLSSIEVLVSVKNRDGDEKDGWCTDRNFKPLMSILIMLLHSLK